MNSTRSRLVAALLAAALAFLPVAEASARGGFRGGGFRSAPSSRSFGTRSLGASRSGWGGATRPSLGAPAASSRLGGISGDRGSASARRGLYDSAKRNGTLFSSRTEAAQSFRGRYAKDYGSSFASEPSARPSYIPGSTLVGGRNVNIVYNQGLGGYGYIHPLLGTWMLYDALSDAAMLDYAMSNRGYYWGGAPVYLSHGPGFMSFALGLLVLFIIASAISGAARRRRERYDR
jgi:hypothetical protein